MTRRDDRQDELGDARVSRAYREWSKERTPPELDRTVLGQAASRAASSRGRQQAWFAPLAFAATLVLGVALLFEMQSETALQTSDAVNGRAPLAADRGDGQRMRNAPANRSESTPQQSLQDFASAAAESATGLSQVGKRAASEPAGEVARHCTAEQTATAKTWWRCVEALRTRGDTVAADREIERLRERFPNFKPD